MASSSTPSHRCPVGARVALREACVGCQGLPATGQRALQRGDVLVRQGDIARHLFAIVTGWLREVVHDEDGRAVAAALAGPGQVLGTTALATAGTEARHAATIDVLSDARVCFVPAERAREWLAAEPQHALELVSAVADAREAARRELALRARPAEDRVLDAITQIVARSIPDAEGWVRLPTTREQLGELLGLTLETVSRMLHRLAERGALELRGKCVRMSQPPR